MTSGADWINFSGSVVVPVLLAIVGWTLTYRYRRASTVTDIQTAATALAALPQTGYEETVAALRDRIRHDTAILERRNQPFRLWPLVTAVALILVILVLGFVLTVTGVLTFNGNLTALRITGFAVGLFITIALVIVVELLPQRTIANQSAVAPSETRRTKNRAQAPDRTPDR